MNNKQTITAINWICTTIIVIACFIFIFEGILSWRKIMKGLEVNNILKFEVINCDSNETLYIKFRAWGLAGNHEEIVISPYRDSLKNPKTDYIIYGLTQLYLDSSHEKVELIIPQENISEPNTKYTNFVIKQYADVSDLTRRYKNNQLIKIDLFDEQNSILIIQKN